jgi:hypothetical protein
MSHEELPGQLSFANTTPTERAGRLSLIDGESAKPAPKKYLKIITGIVVDNPNAVETEKTLAIINVPDRTLEDVQWSTNIDSVSDVTKWDRPPKVLVNPNTIVLIDECELDNES